MITRSQALKRVGPPIKVQEKNLLVDRSRALGYPGIMIKYEKPKRKKIEWHGQQVTLPFDCSVYPEKEVEIANRFSGEKTKMPGYAASVYDTIIGAERFEAYEIVRAGLDWFKKYFPKQYMVVLD